MKRKQSMEEDLRKRMKTAVKKENQSPNFLPSYSSRNRFSHVTLKKHIAQRFSKGEFELLRQEIHSYNIGPQVLVNFFSTDHGYAILNMAVVGESDPEPLNFLFKYAPKESLKNLLSRDNFAVLEVFLITQRGIEDFNQYTDAEKLNEIEKFKLLLKIHPKGVQKFMKEKAKEEYMTERVNLNFLEALQQYEENPLCHEKARKF